MKVPAVAHGVAALACYYPLLADLPAAQLTAASDRMAPRPIVTVTDAPLGSKAFAAQWFRVAITDTRAMLAAVSRPSGLGPFPAVLLLHGTHGFTREYVQWAQELATGGFVAVAACWFSGGGGAGAFAVTAPIACPEIPPLGPGAYPEGLQYIDALLQAVQTLPDVRRDRLALIGHSRGGGAALQYVLSTSQVQAVVLHSAGYGLRPATRAADFSVPILVMHGTNEPAGGGSANNDVALAREFEAALRQHKKTVETRYYEGGGHTTFFTQPTQRSDEITRMLEFLRRHLAR